MQSVKKFENIEVFANMPLDCDITKTVIAPGVCEYGFDLEWNESEAAKSELSGVEIRFTVPDIDAPYLWTPLCGMKRYVDAEWRTKNPVMMTKSAPVATLYNEDGFNRYTFASSETKKVCSLEVGVDEHHSDIFAKLKIGLKQYTSQSRHSITVLYDERKIRYDKALDNVRLWWEKVCPIVPMATCEQAKKPVYSSWYSYHQHISDKLLEQECAAAKKLGCETVIVDDGWQTDDTNCGYAFCGDWEVTKNKFPDMASHVRRIHDIGLKYVLWYSVPFVGYKSKMWDKFKNKIIYKIDRLSAGVLDPRYPDVREYLAGIYENALKNYDLDGFKLDFIDRFLITDENKITDEMDYVCVQEAADALMTEVMRRLKAIKSDILIEFRQGYIGPNMRKYGNMFRVADCPNDYVSNRVGICDLRLLSGSTAVHSDMLMWNTGENPQTVAKQILNCLFGVIQLSVRLETLPLEHRKMVEFWMDFAVKNKSVLLDSPFYPSEPQNLYPVITAYDNKTEITGIYEKGKVVTVSDRENIKLINASCDDKIYINISAKREAKVRVSDCMGTLVSENKTVLKKGVNCIRVPQSGLVEF